MVTNQVYIEKQVDSEYRVKAHKAIDDIEQLLRLRTGNWLFNSPEVDRYRRRTLPSYLLHRESSNLPVYMSQSTLSLAFAEVTSIKLIVNLINY